MGIGEKLARAREDAGLSVADVSRRTRVRETLIRGIERDDFQPCGGNFYARGHIRSIARVLKIDPEPLIREYDDAHGGAPQVISTAASAFEPEAPVAFRERRSPNWSAAMALAFSLVVAYMIFQVFTGEEPTREATTAARPAPVPARSKPAAVAPPPATGAPGGTRAVLPRKNVEVQVKARQASWVSVRDGKGRQLFSGLIHTGDVKKWTAKKRIRIVIGNGGGVKLSVNGKDLGSPGSAGQVLQLSFGPRDPVTA